MWNGFPASRLYGDMFVSLTLETRGSLSSFIIFSVDIFDYMFTSFSCTSTALVWLLKQEHAKWYFRSLVGFVEVK